MDDVDRRILQALRVDGRISNADLAEVVGLSPSACHRRVRILESAKIIRGYTVLVGGPPDGEGLVVLTQLSGDTAN